MENFSFVYLSVWANFYVYVAYQNFIVVLPVFSMFKFTLIWSISKAMPIEKFIFDNAVSTLIEYYPVMSLLSLSWKTFWSSTADAELPAWTWDVRTKWTYIPTFSVSVLVKPLDGVIIHYIRLLGGEICVVFPQSPKSPYFVV